MLSTDFYKMLLDSIFDAVYTVDAHCCITYWNASSERLTGYSAEEMLGRHFRLTPFAYPDERDKEQESRRSGIEIVLETGMAGTWKGYVRRKNGQRIPVESHISPIRNEKGTVIGAAEVFRDISAQVALQDAHRQVLQMSRKDQLTGLYNRSAMTELLKAEVDRSRRYDQSLSVIMADIDHFKRINDRYGHDAGDKVLSRIGAVLRHNLRRPDAVGRWGGEEFLIVAPGSDKGTGGKLAERLRGCIQQIPAEEMVEPITMSFGVAQLAGGQGHDQLIYTADMALYEAKGTGRDRVVIGPARPLAKGAG